MARPGVMEAVGADEWLGVLDTYRTMCVAPGPAFRRMLDEIRGKRLAA